MKDADGHLWVPGFTVPLCRCGGGVWTSVGEGQQFRCVDARSWDPNQGCFVTIPGCGALVTRNGGTASSAD
jgi:hypothetical protein